MKIVPFQLEHKQAFYELNIEWLETYFYVEPFDREVLSKPQKYILDKGGYIFSAVEDEVVGVVALLNHGEKRFELTKMAVRPSLRGKGTGQRLLQHCIDFAKKNDFSSLFLYSNTKLENAIHLYRKYGFQEVALETGRPYERSNIKMVYQGL
ncbi:GNAT family N-acetyltransferase [Luteirhabdus pelagi]|uniref:GNAT family N-acetyltransferase n=1 Tax=Luteirhabdus pelagi TaxID=2792783 RepID=UPI001939352E|nr:GNAT family N-acetyltransferase [Luteirhabdus pelagi]